MTPVVVAKLGLACLEDHLAQVLRLAAQVVATGDGQGPQRCLSCQTADDADDLDTQLCEPPDVIKVSF